MRMHRRRLRLLELVRVDNRRRTAQVGDGVCDAHPLAECHDPDFGLKKVYVKFEEHIACDFLLCGGKKVILVRR